MEKEKKQKLNFEGGGSIRIQCECKAFMNLFLTTDKISICGHCKKESKIEMYQVEVAKGTEKKKFIETQKPIKMPKIKTEVNTRLVNKIQEEIYREPQDRYEMGIK